MKKAGYFILFSVLFMQAVGMLIVYQVQQWAVHAEMARELETRDTGFTRMKMTAAAFEKSRIAPHEISLDGKMYDVKSAFVTGNIVELLVLNDADEEKIVNNICALQHGPDKKNADPVDQLVKLLTLTYIIPAPFQYSFFPHPDAEHFFAFQETAGSLAVDIPSPPPRLV